MNIWPKTWYRVKKVIKPVIKGLFPADAWESVKKAFRIHSANSGIEAAFLEDWVRARQLAPDASRAYAKGLNVIGYFQAASGIGEAARSSVAALRQAQVPVEIIDFEFDVPASQQIDRTFQASFSQKFRHQGNLLHVNPLQMPYLWEHFNNKLAGHYTIGVWYWELPGFPAEWRDRFNVVDEIWVATDFVRQSLLAQSPVPVVKIPPCIKVEYDLSLTRADFNLPEDAFLYLCAYDLRSVHERKNPLAAIRAFQRAFRPEDASVGLVIKINNPQENHQLVFELKRELANYKNCFIISQTFTRSQFNALLGMIDGYVSLHRSEGFGLVPAEAMYLGKPVVMTNWSGNVDFMTPENSCGVQFKLVPVRAGLWPYGTDQLWAEPDIDHAVHFMQKLVADRVYYEQVSLNARQTIQDHFSPAEIGRQMRQRLEALSLV